MPVSDNHIEIAQRFSLPPAIVAALGNQAPPQGLLQTYGLDEKTAQHEPEVVLTVMAHALAQSFRQQGSLSAALSQVLSGDPQAHTSPTSSTAGQVASVMGEAAKNALQGWNGYQPAQPEALTKVAHDFGKYLQATQNMGGIVGDDAIKAYNRTVANVAPPPIPAAQTHQTPAPIPPGPHPADVESFASQMKGMNIDVNHFMEHFPLVSSLRYKMMAAPTGLRDYAPVTGLTKAQIVQHIHEQPHPIYPNLTVGQFSNAQAAATLHSRDYEQRDPAPADIARLAGGGAGWNDIGKFYQSRAEQKTNGIDNGG